MFLTGMSYRDHSKTVADNGFFRFMTHCPTVGSNVRNHQKIDEEIREIFRIKRMQSPETDIVNLIRSVGKICEITSGELFLLGLAIWNHCVPQPSPALQGSSFT
jgi:hypothetical protein